MPLNRTKPKYGSMKLKAYEKIVWMIEHGAMYLLGPIAREFNAKMLYKKQTNGICELYFGVICGLIDNVLHAEKFIVTYKVLHVLQTR